MAPPGEERLAEILLQSANLPADRSLGQVEFLRGPGKGAQARGGFEGRQGAEWRQALAQIRHYIFLYHKDEDCFTPQPKSRRFVERKGDI